MHLVERVLWRLVLVLAIVGAVLCVWAMLGHRLTPTQGKIILTSFGTALYAALGLACAAVGARQPTSLTARAGVGLASVGAVVFALGVWTRTSEHLWWWKCIGLTSVGALAAALASLVLLIDVEPRHAWLRTVTRAGIFTWGVTLWAMMLLERGDDWLWRIVGVGAVIGVFGAVALAALGRLAPREP